MPCQGLPHEWRRGVRGKAFVHVLARIVEAGKKIAESNLIGQVSIYLAPSASIKVLICSWNRNAARLGVSRDNAPLNVTSLGKREFSFPAKREHGCKT